MAFGPGSLSRLECAACKDTTLHKNGKCIHCQTERAIAKPGGTGPRWNAFVDKGGKR